MILIGGECVKREGRCSSDGHWSAAEMEHLYQSGTIWQLITVFRTNGERPCAQDLATRQNALCLRVDDRILMSQSSFKRDESNKFRLVNKCDSAYYAAYACSIKAGANKARLSY